MRHSFSIKIRVKQHLISITCRFMSSFSSFSFSLSMRLPFKREPYKTTVQKFTSLFSCPRNSLKMVSTVWLLMRMVITLKRICGFWVTLYIFKPSKENTYKILFVYCVCVWFFIHFFLFFFFFLALPVFHKSCTCIFVSSHLDLQTLICPGIKI